MGCSFGCTGRIADPVLAVEHVRVLRAETRGVKLAEPRPARPPAAGCGAVQPARVARHATHYTRCSHVSGLRNQQHRGGSRWQLTVGAPAVRSHCQVGSGVHSEGSHCQEETTAQCKTLSTLAGACFTRRSQTPRVADASAVVCTQLAMLYADAVMCWQAVGARASRSSRDRYCNKNKPGTKPRTFAALGRCRKLARIRTSTCSHAHNRSE